MAASTPLSKSFPKTSVMSVVVKCFHAVQLSANTAYCCHSEARVFQTAKCCVSPHLHKKLSLDAKDPLPNSSIANRMLALSASEAAGDSNITCRAFLAPLQIK